MDARSAALMRRTWLRQVLSLLLFAALLFAPAGTLRFWQGWVFALVFVAASSAIGVYFLKHDPALIERRMTAGPAAEQEPAQKIIITTILIGFFLLIVLPGLDFRWHWSDVPRWLVLIANGGVAVSFVVFFVVMKQNSYAASTVRVEAGQPVISTGLYAVVRHPMYAGALLLMICMPLALGSYWSLPLVIVLLPVLAWRLLDEERFLTRNLPGYADYCRQTRSRLIPWIW
jgi:protein-S-isoprenylcysteine O-methyltransferase Ste14